MLKIKSVLICFARWLDADDDPEEPVYDPVHLASVLISVLVALGVLYWLLWTLLVYEGGIFVKIRAFLSVLLTSKTLLDYGYRGYPYAMGVFRGWIGNVSALIVSMFVLWLLHRVYQDTEKKYLYKP